MSEEKVENVENQDSQKLPEAKFLSSFVTSVRKMDESFRHIQVSIFEDVDSHELRIYYDVVDPSNVHPKL